MSIMTNTSALKRLLPFIFLAMLVSCSSDSDSSEEENGNAASVEELLVSGSPWTFVEYRIDEVLDANGANVMDLDFDNQIALENQLNNGLTLEFNSDGTGTTNQPSDFQWELIPNSSIRLTFDENEISESTLSVSESEMILGFEDEFEFVTEQNTIIGIEIRASLVFR